MQLYLIFQLFSLLLIAKSNGISSPIATFTTYKHSTELRENVADLWWTVDDAERQILFELHVKTTGWIALGISPAGGMVGADIGVGWVDDKGVVHFQDRHAFNTSKPIIDNTTNDWISLQGREVNGWTAIQFKRLLDTCDPMDVPIKSGTNIVIFAYGLSDPDECRQNADISYHENRRGTRMIPLRSYDNPPSAEKFAGFDFFDFRLDNRLLPPTDTTYYCKVFKIPQRFSTKRHAISYQILVEPSSQDIVHHMTTYECDSTATFDDSNLPEGICDDAVGSFAKCMSNMANGWAVGGDHMVEYPPEAGYPVGGDFPIKYYMVQIHFDNAQVASDRRDSSGIRFYIGKELRQYDLGYLTLGTESNPGAIVIPPQVDQFVVDAFCPAKATERIPESGITVISAFPHTHLQGKSVWSKLIRNNKATQYLFNAESYNFNYQFQNHLPKPITLYRGDAFITQCTYTTMNKKDLTLGGQRTKDEMCLQTFAYYPRMNDLYVCVSSLPASAWLTMTNSSSLVNLDSFKQWLNSIQWTPQSVAKWQQFFKNSSRQVYIIGGQHFELASIDTLPIYQDLKPEECTRESIRESPVIPTIGCNSASRRIGTFIFLVLTPLIMIKPLVAYK